MGVGSGQTCQEVITPRSSPQPLTNGSGTSSFTTSPLSWEKSEACPLRAPRSPQGAWDPLLKQWPAHWHTLYWLPSLACLTCLPPKSVTCTQFLVLGSDSGQFQLSTVISHINIQTFEVLYIMDSLQNRGYLRIWNLFFQRCYCFQQISYGSLLFPCPKRKRNILFSLFNFRH